MSFRTPFGVCFGCALAVLLSMPLSAAVLPTTQITISAEARYSDANGSQMPPATSNPVTVTVYQAVSIGTAKTFADGQFVALQDSVVTAGNADMGGDFYIQATDRSAGIRVVSSQTVQRGDVVSVRGTLGTNSDSERIISASAVTLKSSGGPVPDPLGVNQATFLRGLDHTGMLITVAGRITAAPGTGYFYVDDGSGLKYGSYRGLLVYGPRPSSAVGKYVLVTGISSWDTTGGGSTFVRVLRTRGSSDIIVLNP